LDAFKESLELRKNSLPIWKFFIHEGWESILESYFRFWISSDQSTSFQSVCVIFTSKGRLIPCQTLCIFDKNNDGIPISELFVFKPL
jgi:hypothetical protein